jgi:hypothetical protein
MACIGAMILLNIFFIVKELLRRSKPEFAEINPEEPKLPEFEKK